jgi:hypothetical protein
MMLQPEPGDTTQQDAGGDLAAAEQLELGVGEELAFDTLPLTEVGRQLQTVLVQNAPPSAQPTAAATSPAPRLTARLANAPESCRSSARR